MNKRTEKLIWNLLFGDGLVYNIDIDKYCSVEERADFREQIRIIIKKGGKTIADDKITHLEDKVIWVLEIKG